MTVEGVDYSVARPNHGGLANAGIRFVCRYLAYKPNPKVLLRGELDTLHGWGFGVILNWEQAEGDMLQGFNKGVAHALEAKKQADGLGCPPQVPIYFSCDVDANVSQRKKVGEYLDGCASVLGRERVGVYGSYYVIEELVPWHARWAWQTYAWSQGQISRKTHLYQYKNNVTLAGGSVDRNKALVDSYGAWFEGDEMLSDDDVNRIAAAVWNRPLDQGTPGYAGQLPSTAEAFDWQASAKAASEATAANAKTTEILDLVRPGLHGSALTEADRTAIQNLADAVTALNNRLSTP